MLPGLQIRENQNICLAGDSDEPGAFDSAIAGTSAASACNSPSISSCGARAFTVLVASTTLSTSLCFALPLVENESIATRGVAPNNARHESAEAIAISANSAADGSITTPQSAKIRAPSLPKLTVGKRHQKKTRYQFESGTNTDAVKRRAHGMRSRVGCAGNRAIGLSQPHHQVAVVKRIVHQSASFVSHQSLGAAQLVEKAPPSFRNPARAGGP